MGNDRLEELQMTIDWRLFAVSAATVSGAGALNGDIA